MENNNLKRKAREEAEQRIKDVRCEGYSQKFGLPPLGPYLCGSEKSHPSVNDDVKSDSVIRQTGTFNILEGWI